MLGRAGPILGSQDYYRVVYASLRDIYNSGEAEQIARKVALSPLVVKSREVVQV